MIIDPRDGQKIFSVLGLKRKLGVERPLECGPLDAIKDAAGEPTDASARLARALAAEEEEPNLAAKRP
eukprot:4453751-Pleurochrysis_carterae.AAC.1